MRWVVLTNILLANLLPGRETNSEVVTPQELQFNQLEGAAHGSPKSTSDEMKTTYDEISSVLKGNEDRETKDEEAQIDQTSQFDDNWQPIETNYSVKQSLGQLNLSGQGTLTGTLDQEFEVKGNGYLFMQGFGLWNDSREEAIKPSEFVFEQSGEFQFAVDAKVEKIKLSGDYDITGSGFFDLEGTGAHTSSKYRGLSLQRRKRVETPISDSYTIFVVSGGLELNGNGSCNFISTNGDFSVVGTGNVNVTSTSGNFYMSSWGDGLLSSHPGPVLHLVSSTTVITSALVSYQIESGKYFSIIAKDAVDLLLIIEGEYSLSGSGSFSGYGTGAYADSLYWTGTGESIGEDSTADLVIPLVGERFFIYGSFPDSHLEVFGDDYFKCHSSDVSIRGVHDVQLKGNGSVSVIGDGPYSLVNQDNVTEDITGYGVHSFSLVGHVEYSMENGTWASVSMTDSVGEVFSFSGSSAARGEYHLSAENPSLCFGHVIFANSYFVLKHTGRRT